MPRLTEQNKHKQIHNLCDNSKFVNVEIDKNKFLLVYDKLYQLENIMEEFSIEDELELQMPLTMVLKYRDSWNNLYTRVRNLAKVDCQNTLLLQLLDDLNPEKSEETNG